MRRCSLSLSSGASVRKEDDRYRRRRRFHVHTSNTDMILLVTTVLPKVNCGHKSRNM